MSERASKQAYWAHARALTAAALAKKLAVLYRAGRAKPGALISCSAVLAGPVVGKGGVVEGGNGTNMMK